MMRNPADTVQCDPGGGFGERGVTMVELGVAMLITALLSTVMITWVFAGVSSENSHRSYDDALADLRQVTDRLGREIRSAGYLTEAGVSSLAYWLDGDRDGVAEAGETITWAIDGSTIVRSADDGQPGAVLATNLSGAASSFAYDATIPGDVTRVTITFVALAETQAGYDELQHTLDIYLRNA